jgi:hypothetical protein
MPGSSLASMRVLEGPELRIFRHEAVHQRKARHGFWWCPAGPVEGSWNARRNRQFARKLDGLIADVHAGDVGAEAGQAKRNVDPDSRSLFGSVAWMTPRCPRRAWAGLEAGSRKHARC